MTVDQMRTLFLIQYDRRSSSSAPGVEDEEITSYLNDAQEEKAEDAYSAYQEGERIGKFLDELIRFDNISTFTVGNHPNAVFVELPDSIWRTLKEEVSLSYTDDCGDVQTKRIPVKPIDIDYYNKYIKNYYKKPNTDRIWRLDFSRTDTTQDVLYQSTGSPKRHELISFDNSTVLEYLIEYFIYPRQMDITNGINCELGPQVHRKIVEHAVTLALESIGSPRYQTHKIEEQT